MKPQLYVIFVAALATIARPAIAQRVSVSNGDSTLRVIIEEVLATHPAASRATHAARAAGQRIVPAGALPDPILSLGVMNLPLPSLSFGRDDFTELDIEASQEFPWPGTRATRRASASAARDELLAEVDELRRQVAAGAGAAWFRLRFLMTALDRLAGQRALLEAAEQLSLARYSTGAAAQSDVLQARLVRQRLRAEEITLQQDSAVALAELNALRSRPPGEAVTAPLLSLVIGPPPLFVPAESLIAQSLASHPRIAGRRAALAQSVTAVRLEQLGARPDVMVMARYGYRSRAGGMSLPDFFSASVGLRLPLWASRKQRPLIEAARADSFAAASSVADAERELLLTVQQAAIRAESGRRRLELLLNDVLPVARATVESLTRSYQVGRVEFQALLAAQDALYRTEIEAAEVAAGYPTDLLVLRLLTAREWTP